MAFITATASTPSRTSILSGLGVRISNFFVRIAEAQNRSVDVQRLESLSDRELADIGIKREDILRHVYRDIYYI